MKITFLGTSHGVPAADRFCTSILLESGENVYLLDAGAPVINLMLKMDIDLKRLKAAFISHSHMDHLSGLADLICLMNWYFQDTAADFYLPEEELGEAMKKYIYLADGSPLNEERLRVKTIDAAESYEDENIKLEYIPTKHMPNGRPSYAMYIQEKSSGKKLLFSGDFSGRLRGCDVPEILAREKIDAFICELAHFTLDDLAPYLETCLADSVYFTHVFPLEKYEGIKAIDGKYSFKVYAPNDGDSVEI